MGMPLRSYEHFEGGHGRLNVERVSRFAEATDTDPFAILAAMAIDSPGLAVRCADNKLMLLLMLQLQDFDAAVGDDLARLDPRAIMGAFRRAFEELQADAARRAQGPDAWRAALATQPDGQPDPD